MMELLDGVSYSRSLEVMLTAEAFRHPLVSKLWTLFLRSNGTSLSFTDTVHGIYPSGDPAGYITNVV